MIPLRLRATGLLVFALATVTLGAAAPARAQQPGRVSGTLQDQTGAALGGVTVRLRGAESRDAQTTSTGAFDVQDLRPGEYRVTAEKSGFESIERAIRVGPGETVRLSLVLRVAILEQTIVTAAKAGGADVQTTPMAISALSNADLARLATRTIDQAAALVPLVTFTQNSTFGQLSIRGIGTNAVLAGSDPSSAMYVDGVYLARPAMVFADFLDLDRLEVLRGPQGTLYGRNAMGGAVNLISRPPSNDFEASGRITVGNLQEIRAEARASGPLKRDKVMASVSFVRGARDGYVRDLEHPDEALGADDLTAARGQVRVVLDRRTDVLVSTDVNNQSAPVLTYNKVLAVKPGFVVDNPPDPHEVRASQIASSGVLQYGASARLTSALTPSTTLVSLSAFRKMDNEYLVDADITELDVLTAHNLERQHQFSEELTLSQRKEGLTWVAGLFVFTEAEHQTVRADQPAARIQVQLDPRVNTTSAAVFAQTTIGLTSQLSATAGLRYTHEEKEIENAGGRYGLDPPMAAIPGSTYGYADAIQFAAWTPRLGLEMKLPGGIAYGSATRGFKSGGFNVSSTQTGRGYEPEWAWSYEGGVKTELMSGRARLNVAVFHMDYTNLQVQTPIGIGVFDVRNAAAATIRGVEVETTARIGRGLTAGGHLAWLDATYDQYTAVGPGGVTGDVAGNRLNNAPEWSGRAWIEWTGMIGPLPLSLAADGSAQSTVFYTPFNDSIQRQRPYGLLGVRAEYGPSHRHWSVSGYVRNVTDADYITATFATSPVAFGGRPGPTRQAGIQLVLRR
jgi:iron complex outermembrane receptor protein